MKKYLLASLLLVAGLAACQTTANTSKNTQKREQAEELKGLKKAYFASGCFWCVEAIYESLKGVKEVISGYSGGTKANPTYEEVGRHTTGHAESVEVFYDPEVVDFKTLVEVYYDSQDPTTYGQNPDFGESYRSIIFYSNEEEKQIAEDYKNQLAQSGKYSKPIVTEIIPFEKFWPAEDYHQNYEKLHPDQAYVRSVSIPRLNRFKAKHPELLKENE
ncbi:peptide-methionine (S)-S-oxide reductase MsrA [Marinilongibacter aquaticus]|uniref:peptide-methionine (S)-S-oxide reductase MsrA n=1 Tax=Marinilongibacter aquaticus TaxID=2975157 RepID=UPI0021BD1237|nr:peptide-methionine (S)-S-oxide reductase MsrA [Marinilongibacter aquaticus]UBM59864.1 peptide-methionine (S)-S-oxide reductase MsrA [Marinilongibacter aquaticus]